MQNNIHLKEAWRISSETLWKFQNHAKFGNNWCKNHKSFLWTQCSYFMVTYMHMYIHIGLPLLIK